MVGTVYPSVRNVDLGRHRLFDVLNQCTNERQCFDETEVTPNSAPRATEVT